MIKREKLSNKNKALTYLLGGTILLSSHISQGFSPENNFLADMIHKSYSRSRDTGVANDGASVTPGMGYYSYTQMPLTRNCLENAEDPERVSYHSPVSSIHFDNSVSLDQMENILNTKISGRGGFSLFRTSASANYLKSSQSTRYSQAFNYYQSFAATASYQQPKSYGESALSNFAQQALARSPQNFIDVCGDSYVSVSNAGAVLSVSVNVNFFSTTDKHNFEQSTSAGVLGLGKITEAVKTASSQYKMQGSISVNALQLGGDPTRLGNIFQKGNEGYYFLSCDFDHLDDCNKGINSILDYAKNDFANQIKFVEGKPVNTGALYYFSLQTPEKYSSLGISLLASPPSAETRNKQLDLTTWYNQDSENLIFIKHFLNSEVRPYFPEETYQTLETFQKNLVSRLADYSYVDTSSACWGPSLSVLCHDAYEFATDDRVVYPVKEEVLDFFKYNAFVARHSTTATDHFEAFFIPLNIEGQFYRAIDNSDAVQWKASLSYNSSSLSFQYSRKNSHGIFQTFTGNNLPYQEAQAAYVGPAQLAADGKVYKEAGDASVRRTSNPL